MKITYDKEVDAAYLRLSDGQPSGVIEISEGVNLDIIRKLRERAWSAYKRLMAEIPEQIPFDYRPAQESSVFNSSEREHLSFKRIGLSVPVEAQAAFFSVLVTGI